MSYTLTVAAKAPVVAYPALIAAAFVNSQTETAIKIDFVDEKAVDKAAVKLTKGDETFVDNQALEKLAADFPKVLLEGDASKEWIKFAAEELTIKDFKKLSVSLEKLDAHLNYRSYIVGYKPSLADIAVWGYLRSNGVIGSVIKNTVYINVSRWYTHLESNKTFGGISELFTKSVAELRKQAKVKPDGKKETHKANFDIDLKDAVDGQVVTRFPPEPSGYLHIGHAKAAILNKYFADQYHGKLIIRFDDTNPSKEKVEFEESIIEDLRLLGIKGDKQTYSSDYFDHMYDLAVKLIKEGKAYADDTPLEKMRQNRMDGIASDRRDRTVEENLKIFTEDMKNATEEGLKNCIRAKISVDNPNKALRDPVIYRCNLTPHHRTGSQWKMYPTYDFCVPVVDSLEGVTHALRTIEYKDRDAQYEWFLKALNIRKVHLWEFARVNFVRTLLSKRKLQWFVDKNYVSNWDDPRFPTVRGVRRRGMTVEGLKNFVISQGPSKNIINLDWSIIWAANKKVIDPVAPRHTAVVSPVKVHIVDGPAKPYTEKKPKHKKNPDVGEKDVIYASDILIDQEDADSFEDGEELTLMDWGNVIITKLVKEGEHVKSIEAKLNLDGDFRKTKHKVTWLADTPEKVSVDLVDFDHLITKDKLEDGDDFENFLTPKTEFHTEGLADVNVASMKVGDIIQFERKGYYRLDKQAEGGKPAVFFTIPDGKTVNKYGAKK
ncbi:hypothetical protein WICANDRAFT_65048 [Wickerhamomyces anomalus NRRL Y-366-8]|uniref:glutamate--tRNA ligase n=1 Tax=Wickerhamomyces anomalus (strain ATCC 58044 / CBS 1984 / NCYC 433 / NRRL Y-366-8) TaxID=683960 RepID=A0A1E3NYC6_WICAA|nr:uncharacterized protein WICANDRAFT_65048 [Wickerhamomyces anomalus NRRL Y-366-8]ODQ57702.1 hypothetical protein WICANDRAFT_65048 [Wickerhamomyces anomalus NRRL Y-366-8]